MWSPVNNFIPDRSRLGLTTAATGTVSSRVPVKTMLLMGKEEKRTKKKSREAYPEAEGEERLKVSR